MIKKIFIKSNAAAQSSMEYLMTYGWAILIISIVLAAMWQIGVFNSAPQATKAHPGSCRVARLQTANGGVQVSLMGTCSRLLPQYVAQFNSQTISYISIPYSSYLYPQSQITISVWVETTATSSSVYWMNIVNTAGDDANCDNGSYCIRACCGNIYGHFYTGSSGDAAAFSETLLNNGKWHMLTTTYNGVAVQIYLDGVQQNSGPLNGPLRSNANEITLGDDGNQGYPGMLSNVQIYNISLTTSEIQSLYLEGIGGAPLPMPNLRGWWPLNGDTVDYSGNNNNGVPTNVVMNSSWSSG